MDSKKIASCRRVLYNKNVLIDKSSIYLITLHPLPPSLREVASLRAGGSVTPEMAQGS